MNRKSGSGSGVFLMEMMVVVFFFMLCASTCILAFAKADRMSRVASERNQAVSAAQSVAEVWKLEGMDGLVNRMYAYNLPEGAVGRSGIPTPEGAYRIYWDEDWQCVEPWVEIGNVDFKYTAELLETEDESGIRKLFIHVQEGEHFASALFELEVFRHGEQ